MKWGAKEMSTLDSGTDECLSRYAVWFDQSDEKPLVRNIRFSEFVKNPFHSGEFHQERVP